MDTIMACAVGLDIDCLNNPENPFFTKSLLVFKDLEKLKFMFIVTSKPNNSLIQTRKWCATKVESNRSFFCNMTAYLSEFRPYLLELLSISTWIMSHFQDRFEKYIDPLFWLTQKISYLIDTREENKVNGWEINKLIIFNDSNWKWKITWIALHLIN